MHSDFPPYKQWFKSDHRYVPILHILSEVIFSHRFNHLQHEIILDFGLTVLFHSLRGDFKHNIQM